jgi:protein SCO1
MNLTTSRFGRDGNQIRRSGRVRVLAAVIALITVALACSAEPPRELSGYIREPRPVVDQVALPDLSRGGQDFVMRASPGNLLVVYFGFTNCPDVCPTTLADLRGALRRMEATAAERVTLAVVTVDPKRDADTLTGYAQTFVDGAHALATFDPALLRAAADPFGVSYAVTTNDKGEIEVAHSSQMFVVDDQGQLLLTWPFGISAEDLALDLTQLLASNDSRNDSRST